MFRFLAAWSDDRKRVIFDTLRIGAALFHFSFMIFFLFSSLCFFFLFLSRSTLGYCVKFQIARAVSPGFCLNKGIQRIAQKEEEEEEEEEKGGGVGGCWGRDKG